MDGMSEIIIDIYSGFLLKSRDISKILNKLSRSSCEDPFDNTNIMINIDKMRVSHDNLVLMSA